MQTATIAFDSFNKMSDEACQERIRVARAKLGKKAVILGHHYQRAYADRSGVGGIGHEAVYVLLEHLAGGGHEVVIDELLHLLFQGLEHREGRHHAEHHGNHGHQGEQGHIGQVTGGDRQPVLLETAPDKLGEMGTIVAQEGECVGQAAADLLLHLDSRKRHHADIVSDRVPI